MINNSPYVRSCFPRVNIFCFSKEENSTAEAEGLQRASGKKHETLQATENSSPNAFFISEEFWKSPGKKQTNMYLSGLLRL